MNWALTYQQVVLVIFCAASIPQYLWATEYVPTSKGKGSWNKIVPRMTKWLHWQLSRPLSRHNCLILWLNEGLLIITGGGRTPPLDCDSEKAMTQGTQWSSHSSAGQPVGRGPCRNKLQGRERQRWQESDGQPRAPQTSQEPPTVSRECFTDGALT